MRARRVIPGLALSLALVVSITLGGAPSQRGGQAPAEPPPPDSPRVAALKAAVAKEVDARRGLTAQMVDMVYSFGELGFQEFETSKYLTGILEKQGFRIERDIAGIPTGWVATWGSGKPVIALGSDVDCIPQASQKPGVAYHDPIVEGAPGHGEGHNTGQPLVITAALAAKAVMEREHLPGTIKIFPGIAEELLGGKAYFVRAGVFKDVDAVLFNHIGSNFGVSWGASMGSGLVSVEYLFEGESAHAAGAPWRGRSALDAVELMDVGWNFRREHLRLQQRSHSIISDGGDQPNVVPSTAGVWYYFREVDYPHIKELREIGDTMATAAAMMTNTKVHWRVLGAAWPQHGNRTLAEMTYANIRRVGLPEWSEADLALAKATQHELGVPERGLATEIGSLRGRESIPESEQRGGASDDIGDVMWNVPTATLMYPANFSAGPGHHWSNGIAEATPIAHKGVTAGAKVQAMNIVDLVTRPEVVRQAWDYFNNVQTKDQKYVSLLGPDDQPAIWLNKEKMEAFRPEMRKYYFDPTKYSSYLEQLGIAYPTIRK
jgi:aminobenzoyl-glutamate utilization protein B